MSRSSKTVRLRTLISDLVVVLAGGLGLALVMGAPTSADPGCSPTMFWTSTDPGSGVTQNVYTNNFGGGTVEFLLGSVGTGTYGVCSQTTALTGSVLAYPNINEGCSLGTAVCTNGWTSYKESALVAPKMSWSSTNTQAVSGTQNDDGADIWFTSGQTPSWPTVTAEVFVSVFQQGRAQSGTLVTLNGTQWYYKAIPRSNSSLGANWTEYVFSRATNKENVTNVGMMQFFNYVQSQPGNSLSSNDYLVNWSAGQEIWAGGAGLGGGPLSISLP